MSRSFPRTKLPFLQNVVKRAVSMPLTTSSSTPFRPYPLSSSPATKQSSGCTILYSNPQCVIVNDAFPKSMVHCLVMPLNLALTSLNVLNSEHVSLLKHMEKAAVEYVQYLRTTEASRLGKRRFIIGFHALPSLPMLHMHLLSMDLDSACLKTKKHYNSFTTPFFLTVDRVISDLEQNGEFTLNKDVDMLRRMEEQNMKCLWCNRALENIPQMRNHIKECSQNKSLIN
ncbi:unnamed protein product [Phytomonas sp. Hart1]|nr:unnamed protein product [Phytomonas sp. Hart1]|eukprot:CCW67434.1 unnamed protein product [Phytomonas sp. isolate Hart1]